jgi:exodeoxyribonuclease V gamma subunit
MPGPNIFISNRLETLVAQLAQIVRQPLTSPTSPEVIIVQSRGMDRWLSMELAKYNGIWAHFSFPFPNVFLQAVFEQFVPDMPQPFPWDPDIMTFAVMKILPACIDRPGFENLKIYLENDPGPLKRFQLSVKIADTFDQYMVFRPEMIFKWEEGLEDTDRIHSWQAQLWRELILHNGPMHRARLRQKLLERLKQGAMASDKLPERLSVFGISYLPLFHLETLAALSRSIQLNIFLLNPCKEYWVDIVSDKEIQRLRRKFPRTDDISEELHFEEGNRLLASLGALGRDFFHLIDTFDCQPHELFEEPRSRTMLARIQSDILNLKDGSAPVTPEASNESSGFTPVELFSGPNRDTSIQVHCCHSPMREIEVLHDNLLAMFEENAELLPKDIIVMAPDVEIYAPFIHAVFDAQTRPELRIPFSIADQSTRKTSRIIDGFLSLLDLKDSRLGATQVLGLLEFPGLKENFGISGTEVPIIEDWIRQTRIRWGQDAEDRLQRDLPRFSENSWQTGIKRLLLGYAMPGYDREMFDGILPFDHIEGSEIKLLGRFLEFVDRVFVCKRILEKPKSLRHWCHALHFMLQQFFLPQEDTVREIQAVQNLIDELVGRQLQSGFDEKIDLEVIKAYLCGRFEKNRFGSGFMSWGVTFCSMLPMRSIPFKIICLIGMNVDAFPRDIPPLSFDLIAKEPRRGDRSRRMDDKYLFLEAIISARNKLYISYVGQSVQDNSRIPPSVLVDELLDAVEKSFDLPDNKIADRDVTYHRLQPFSPFYFQGDPKLFSYSEDDMHAVAHRQNRTVPGAFISGKLSMTPAEEQEWKSLDIDTLGLFYSNPIKFLLEKRLGIFFEQGAARLEDRENFELTSLDRYAVEQNLFKSRRAGLDLQEFQPIQQATGQMPPGNVGNLLYNEMSLEANRYVDKIEKVLSRKISEPLAVDLDISGFQLQGRLTDIYEYGYVRLRYAGLRAKDLLKSWIYHLVYCRLKCSDWPSESILVCKDGAVKFSYSNESRKHLETLLKFFRRGLSEPLPFFPESSMEYSRQLQKKGPNSRQHARTLAKRRWLGSEYMRGESKDPYYDLCFGKMDPIDAVFEEAAQDIFLPLLKHCTEMVL